MPNSEDLTLSDIEYEILSQFVGVATVRGQTFSKNHYDVDIDSDIHSVIKELERRKMIKFNGPTSKTAIKRLGLDPKRTWDGYYIGAGCLGHKALAARKQS